MTVLDIFSWLPAKEISLEDIEKIVPALYAKKATIDGYTLETDMSEAANENVTHATEELLSEGKKVCYLLKEDRIIAAIGYR